MWPPAGLGLAVLFLYGIRLWPGVVIGDLLLADFSPPLGAVIGQTVGNTVSLVAAALLFDVWRPARTLARTLDVVALVVCAVVAALVSAAFGPPALRLGDVVSADELGRVFRTWALSDMAGVLVVAPAAHLGAAGLGASAGATSSKHWGPGRAGRAGLAGTTAGRALHRVSRCCSGRRCAWASRRGHGDHGRLLDHGVEHGAGDRPLRT